MRMGDLIILQDKVNSDNNEFPVLGLNKEKSFMPTVANVNDVNLQKYKVVEKGWFAFSGMQTGRDVCIRLARYTDDFPALISPAYTTFTLRDRVGEKEISPAYVFMFFNREESDRYGAFISDSSVRANLDWSRFCDIEIPVPDIEIQRQLVNVWEGLNSMKQDNEAQAEPLMELCMSYLKKLSKKYSSQKIGQYILEFDTRNSDNEDLPVLGLNREKTFISTAANLSGVNLKKYKVIKNGDFVFSGMQTGRDRCIRLSLYFESISSLVSPAYTTFRINRDFILPEFFYLHFLRTEMDRYGAFISDSSVRANLDWSRFMDITIPIPPKPIQQAVVDIYNCAKESKSIAEQAEQLRRIAGPALMQKAINS